MPVPMATKGLSARNEATALTIAPMMNKIKLNDASVTFMFPSKFDRLRRDDARDAFRRGHVLLDNVM